jgi:hypothetical protein
MEDVAVVSVTDSFEIKPNTAGSQHAPGVVIIFDGRQCGFQLPPVGSKINLLRPDGSRLIAILGESKEHGDGRSFFIAGARREDAPIGTVVSWAISLSQGKHRSTSEAAA